MKYKKLFPFFLISLFFTLLATSLFPYVKWLSFAPFLVITYSSRPLIPSLWIAAFSGLIMDILSQDNPFGLHCLNYVLTTLLIHRYRHYFVDRAIGLASYTFLFSSISTLIQFLGHCFFASPIPITLIGCITDFICLPLLDALYSFIWFSCPLFMYNLIKKYWIRFLFFRKEFRRKKTVT